MDADGHIRLTDFGLCKANVTGYGVDGGAHTFCGTPEVRMLAVILVGLLALILVGFMCGKDTRIVCDY